MACSRIASAGVGIITDDKCNSHKTRHLATRLPKFSPLHVPATSDVFHIEPAHSAPRFCAAHAGRRYRRRPRPRISISGLGQPSPSASHLFSWIPSCPFACTVPQAHVPALCHRHTCDRLSRAALPRARGESLFSSPFLQPLIFFPALSALNIFRVEKPSQLVLPGYQLKSVRFGFFPFPLDLGFKLCARHLQGAGHMPLPACLLTTGTALYSFLTAHFLNFCSS